MSERNKRKHSEEGGGSEKRHKHNKEKKPHHKSKHEPKDEVTKLKNELAAYTIVGSEYSRQSKLGTGSFGTVWLSQNRTTGWLVAEKELITTQLDGQQLEFFIREVKILASCHDRFLLNFVGFTFSPPFSILTTYMPCGSLWDMIHNHKAALNDTQKTNIALGIAKGMCYLHGHNIIHRDLKSPNILLDEQVLPRIADFGLGRFIESTGIQQMTTRIGTPIWMSPELIQSQPYDQSVDVYAYGMILYELLTETIPFYEWKEIDIFDFIVRDNKRPPLPGVNPQLENLIAKCWDVNPNLRPSFEEIRRLFMTHTVFFTNCEAKGVDGLVRKVKQFDDLQKQKILEQAQRFNSICDNEIGSYSYSNEQLTSELLINLAYQGDPEEFAACLLCSDLSVNCYDAEGNAPIHISVIQNNPLFCQFLIRLRDLDFNIKNSDGNTPLMLSIILNNQRILSQFVSHKKVDPNVQNKKGQTALHLLAAITEPESQAFLTRAFLHGLRNPINESIQDNQGKTAFDYSSTFAKEYQRIKDDMKKKKK